MGDDIQTPPRLNQKNKKSPNLMQMQGPKLITSSKKTEEKRMTIREAEE